LGVAQGTEPDRNQRAEEELKKPVLLKGTASAVPQMAYLQCGFSRWGTLFLCRSYFFSTLLKPDLLLAARMDRATPIKPVKHLNSLKSFQAEQTKPHIRCAYFDWEFPSIRYTI
jgi:hypothetical protein